MSWDFEKNVVDAKNVVVDLQTELENGSIYGWNAEGYKNKTTKCDLNYLADEEELNFVLYTGVCNDQIAAMREFEERQYVPYQLRRVYHDPT